MFSNNEQLAPGTSFLSQLDRKNPRNSTLNQCVSTRQSVDESFGFKKRELPEDEDRTINKVLIVRVLVCSLRTFKTNLQTM